MVIMIAWFDSRAPSRARFAKELSPDSDLLAEVVIYSSIPPPRKELCLFDKEHKAVGLPLAPHGRYGLPQKRAGVVCGQS